MNRKYKHIYERVEYPSERGYRWEPRLLPDWMFVLIEEDTTTDSKTLYVHSRIHVNKRVQVGPSYSASSFDDLKILKDLSSEIWSRFIK